ncbi:hypothetical protein [Parachlamydia acanthamoebae]|uniref:Uncharacterized protein n=2 Tax=Parachlamydia acanthamoebae TaxID=83552 RepID=F8L1I4_PARAV|nr:hypothetical protein [Parachlamydia acanthamoebae]EFB40069.1 hypothetical protein pah_c272o012 [Parachlamydia acanthamoebae str. Hall's coccus]CCB87126.1 putative uncharacterized protein [Parachlamydia acanthamoebae UV-7]
MSQIAYFKRQAKNLFRDYKTKTPSFNDILTDYHYSENGFSLMKAQHIIACMAGFGKWGDLLKASTPELELAKLLFDNKDKIPVQHWKKYISEIEHDYGINFDAEARLSAYKHDYKVTFGIEKNKKSQLVSKPKEDIQIISLPLSEQDRAEFIESANRVFEAVLWRMIPSNPGITLKLWNAEDYVDNMLTNEMIPISKNYALSLIDAFMVHHVLGLAKQADKMTEQS